MKNKEIIGVDLGGTNIVAARIKNGEILQSTIQPTEASKPKDEVLKNLLQAINNIRTEQTAAIGIGMPGILDPHKGIIHDIVNIRSWNGFSLVKALEEHLNLTVKIHNDANCFALGTSRYGVAKAYQNVIALALGTGLGGGIIDEGKIVHGMGNGAGEFGQIPYLDLTYEDYCSGKYFSEINKVNGEDIFKKATTGNIEALKLYNGLGRHIGNLAVNIVYSLAPQAIVFGGSVSHGFDFFMPAVSEVLIKLPLQHVAGNVELLKEDNPNIALLGAAALCL